MSLMVRLMDLERRLKALEARRDLDEGAYARIEGDTPLDAVGVLTPAVPDPCGDIPAHPSFDEQLRAAGWPPKRKPGRPRKEIA